MLSCKADEIRMNPASSGNILSPEFKINHLNGTKSSCLHPFNQSLVALELQPAELDQDITQIQRDLEKPLLSVSKFPLRLSKT